MFDSDLLLRATARHSRNIRWLASLRYHRTPALMWHHVGVRALLDAAKYRRAGDYPKARHMLALAKTARLQLVTVRSTE